MVNHELGLSPRSLAASGDLSSAKASDASTAMSGTLSSTSSMDTSIKSSLSSSITESSGPRNSPRVKDTEGNDELTKLSKRDAAVMGSMDPGEIGDETESTGNSFSNAMSKPHKANDLKWEAIQSVRSVEGSLGLNHFRLLRRVGCGDIGSVYLSQLRGTNCYFAIKVMEKGSLASRKKLLRARTEKEILQLLDHPFLPTLYTHFETDKFTCLVMEFCPGGDLHTLRQRQPGKHFSEIAARFYAAQVLLALEYLHMLGIVYRDLKPENVLVRQDGHIMLTDFDLSLQCVVKPTLVKSASTMETDACRRTPAYCVQPGSEPACFAPSCVARACLPPSCLLTKLLPSLSIKKSRKLREEFNEMLPELLAEPTGTHSMSFVGTHEYLAPEIIRGEGHGSAVDWWTFGIFLYELLHGRTPFKGMGNRATLFNVVDHPLRFPETPVVSYAARDLITGLLVKDPEQRLGCKRGASEIKQHPFFEYVNWALIRSMVPPEIPRPFELHLCASKVVRSPPPATNNLPEADMQCKEFDCFF